MADKRLLYITAGELQAFHWKGGRLNLEARFESGEDGLSAFGSYVHAARRAVFFVLIDVVEEDFHFETIPYVRGRDRRTLLTRKLAQRYRDLSLAAALSLGHESGARKEERILFSSFTNTQPLQPWLMALKSHESRVVGAYSIPLLSPQAARRIGFNGKRYLLVSLQQAGLRQTFVDNGQMRFSRLGRADPRNPAQVAQSVATDSARIEQYLSNTRILARDSGPLEVLVLAPEEHMHLYGEACADTAQLHFHPMSLEGACRRAGLKGSDEGMLAERLFLHILASTPPSDQYLDDEQRRFYHVWRVRETLLNMGAAVGFFCLFFAGMRTLDIYNITAQTSVDRAEESRFAATYANLQARFPKMPTSQENLKALIDNYQIFQRQNSPPDRLLAILSQALAATPQIDIDRIEWRIGSDIASKTGDGAAKDARPASPDAQNGARPDTGRVTQVIEISGRVNVAQASDYRNISQVINQFVRALDAEPGIEVLSARLPFDINAEKSLSGDIGVERQSDVPRFTVIASSGGGS